MLHFLLRFHVYRFLTHFACQYLWLNLWLTDKLCQTKKSPNNQLVQTWLTTNNTTSALFAKRKLTTNAAPAGFLQPPHSLSVKPQTAVPQKVHSQTVSRQRRESCVVNARLTWLGKGFEGIEGGVKGAEALVQNKINTLLLIIITHALIRHNISARQQTSCNVFLWL